MHKSEWLGTEADTIALGARMARRCAAPCVIYLQGELGAGKTAFARGFLRACGYEGIVKSPSFSLVESYPLGERVVHHFDFYRVNDPSELEGLGLEEYFTPEAICLIEWPERGAGRLPPPQRSCLFEVEGDGRRVWIQ